MLRLSMIELQWFLSLERRKICIKSLVSMEGEKFGSMRRKLGFYSGLPPLQMYFNFREGRFQSEKVDQGSSVP
jgi:hypothetical protein